MTRTTTAVVAILVIVCVLLAGCPAPPGQVTNAQSTPPVGPGNAPAPEEVGETEAGPALNPDQVPSNRAQFEAWVRATSPHAPRTRDEKEAVAALDEWLRTECEMVDLTLLPAPDCESKQMPDRYLDWYKESDLGVYLWDNRVPPDLGLVVGPPQACSWCIAHMGKEGGKWVLMKATTYEDEHGEVVLYERGKGFVAREDAPGD